GALGTDTAGSVRIPAAHCGLVGLKPTQGRVSTRGVLMLSWTLDQVGPLCKSVEDAALLLGCIAGYDPREPVALDRPVPDYTQALGTDVAKLRLGIASSPYFEGLDAEVERLVGDAVELLRSLTAGTREVQLPAAPSGASIWGPEAYAYHKPWITTSPELYQNATRAALERYADADAAEYAQARRDVEVARRAVLDVFGDVDVLLTPVMREPAPLLSAGGGSGASAGTADFNVFGLPAISVPCGFTRAGLPVGLQIAAAPFMEERLLALASHYERLTDWHLRKPSL
ncbi:MAG TPA: amidase, partial [Hyphomicrobiales bacterium]|nr:amidase [Hyphomicrobiales bacterium]